MKIYTEVELTVSMAQTLVSAAIDASIKSDMEGFHYTAMSTVRDARALLPALGKWQESYTQNLDTLDAIYKRNADEEGA